MAKVKVTCGFCGKVYSREIGRFNEAKKFGWKQYCSRKCQSKNKYRRIEMLCGNPDCGKKVSRLQNQFKRSKSGHIFCSSSCFAIVNNASKKTTKNCPICGKNFSGINKYCSRTCLSKIINPKKIPIEKYKERVINKIIDFYKKNERIPVKKEMYGLYRTARKLFGTWNKTIEAAGFKPNPVLFAEKHIANDGHKCDSFAEKIIDDWLNTKNIKHKREVPYPEDRTLTADFVIKNNWVEFFGLAGELKEYDKLVKRKQILSKKYKLQLIEIYPKDLFPINRLSEIIKI